MQKREQLKRIAWVVFIVIEEAAALCAVLFQCWFANFIVFQDYRFLRVNNIPLFIVFIILLSAPLLAQLFRIVITKVMHGELPGSGIGLLIGTFIWVIPIMIFSFLTPNIVDSYTTYIYDYNDYDRIVSDDNFFPDYIPYSDLKEEYKPIYYYHHTFFIDPTYDIYAEWYLTDEALEAEIDRIEGLFESSSFFDSWTDCTVVTKGDFTCYIKYKNGTPIFEELDESENDYDYTIFAFNKKTGQVRYIINYCMDGRCEQPHYLGLKW